MPPTDDDEHRYQAQGWKPGLKLQNPNPSNPKALSPKPPKQTCLIIPRVETMVHGFQFIARRAKKQSHREMNTSVPDGLQQAPSPPWKLVCVDLAWDYPGLVDILPIFYIVLSSWYSNMSCLV